VADQVEPARAEAPASSSAAQSCRDQLADIAGDGLGRADRLGEGAADLDQLRRRTGSIGSRRIAQRLVEAAAELGAEAQGQRRARLRQEIADAAEAERRADR
jgi:hypothetical protein